MHDFIPESLRNFVKIKETSCELGTIYTYSVIPIGEDGLLKSKSLKLDDYTYKFYPKLINLIPRGFSILYSNEDIEICRLSGMKKFDGTSVLDDDSGIKTNLINFDIIKKWENYNELKVSFQEKANGKMIIFKFFEYDNSCFIFGGSKNVHKLYKIGKNLPINDEYDLAFTILQKVADDFNETDRHNILNKTIIGEYVDGKHIVYVPTPYIIYFHNFSNVKHILPDQSCIPTKEQYEFIRNLTNTEGCVIVYQNIKTGEIYRQKHKSIWYILIRVIREQVCHKKKNNSEQMISLYEKVVKTIEKRNDDFLHLSVEELTKWYKLVYDFIDFVKESNYDFCNLSFSNIGMANVWNEFINREFKTEVNPELTKVNQTCLERPLPDDVKSYLHYIDILISTGIKVCVIMRGVSGSGKSTLAKKLNKNGQIFSTDSYFEKNGNYEFDVSKLTKYHIQNFNEFSNSTKSLLIVDNTNLTRGEYYKYLINAKNRGYITIILNMPIMKADQLLQSSTHISDMKVISSMITRFNKHTPKPAYYGVFLNQESLISFEKFKIVQTTPLHSTCSMSNEYNNSFGRKVMLHLKKYCINKAGRCFRGECSPEDKYLWEKSVENIHITLETFKGYKPVDVGTFPYFESSEIDIIVYGIYGPIF